MKRCLPSHQRSETKIKILHEEDIGFEKYAHYFKKTYLSELALRNTIAVHNDSVGLVTSCGLVKHHQMIFDHGGQIIDDFGPEVKLKMNSLNCGRG